MRFIQPSPSLLIVRTDALFYKRLFLGPHPEKVGHRKCSFVANELAPWFGPCGGGARSWSDPAGSGPLAERDKVPSRKKNKSLDVDRRRMYDSLWKKKAVPDKPLTNAEWILKQRRLLYKATGLPENPTPEKRLENQELMMLDAICCLAGRNDALTQNPIARKHMDALLAPFLVYWQHMNDILPGPPAGKKK
jgi:hypothetical protein